MLTVLGTLKEAYMADKQDKQQPVVSSTTPAVPAAAAPAEPARHSEGPAFKIEGDSLDDLMVQIADLASINEIFISFAKVAFNSNKKAIEWLKTDTSRPYGKMTFTSGKPLTGSAAFQGGVDLEPYDAKHFNTEYGCPLVLGGDIILKQLSHPKELAVRAAERRAATVAAKKATLGTFSREELLAQLDVLRGGKEE
jgi:hypothetical protein